MCKPLACKWCRTDAVSHLTLVLCWIKFIWHAICTYVGFVWLSERCTWWLPMSCFFYERQLLVVKIRKEAINQNQAGRVCRLDRWDDVQAPWFGAVVQKTDASFFLWSDSELGRVLGYLCIFSNHVLCCMMAFDHQKVVTKNQAKTLCV